MMINSMDRGVVCRWSWMDRYGVALGLFVGAGIGLRFDRAKMTLGGFVAGPYETVCPYESFRAEFSHRDSHRDGRHSWQRDRLVKHCARSRPLSPREYIHTFPAAREFIRKRNHESSVVCTLTPSHPHA